MELICPTCNKGFKPKPSHAHRRHFCSRQCKRLTDEAKKRISLKKKGKPSPRKGIKTGIIPPNKGTHLQSNTGRTHFKKGQYTLEDNPNYKGDNISYVQMHRRVRRERGKPENYPCAMNDKSCRGEVEWASISHNANLDIQDYIPLCRSHHRRYDYRQE